MLEKDEVSQITEIIEKGMESMEEDGYKDYCLQFVRWDDEESFWIVGFYTEESNLEFVGVTVRCDQRGYMSVGRSYG